MQNPDGALDDDEKLGIFFSNGEKGKIWDVRGPAGGGPSSQSIAKQPKPGCFLFDEGWMGYSQRWQERALIFNSDLESDDCARMHAWPTHAILMKGVFNPIVSESDRHDQIYISTLSIWA